MTAGNHKLLSAALLASLGVLSSCSSMWHENYGGIRYSIAPDKRHHRVEKGANGRLMYDSPELTVISENGQLNVNGEDVATLKKGDRVEIAENGVVRVNGEVRGDSSINRLPPERIEHTVR